MMNRSEIKNNLLILIVIFALILIFAKLYPFNGIAEWTGFGKDSNKSVTTEQEINPRTNEVIKITKKETKNFQSSKTLWDLLQLGGTFAIPLAVFYFD
ncbi:MAG: HU family DNA-binding protein [Nostoc sp.]|uniref:HU family DNA-binding protein n=1 Tax=unclassified Nostoc TaxID=2593658 RepID=UPI0025D483D7|nr:HU family DNA-binding protein [Nostoc sp. NMS9]MBN3944251.1 HU family DNA-binding protein [Nostoc sp. NMS9]